MTAIQAEIINYKFINGRKVMQIILEAPLEAANHIISTLGYLNPAETTWVGVARLNLVNSKNENQDTSLESQEI